MSIVFFSTGETGGKLPYAEDAVISSPELIGVNLVIVKVVQRPKGFIICTSFYSSFMFSGKTVTEDLREALNNWTEGTVPTGTLICQADEWGEVKVGIDSAIPCEGWSKVGREYVQTIKKKLTSRSQSKKKKTNQFLSSPNMMESSSPLDLTDTQYEEMEQTLR